VSEKLIGSDAALTRFVDDISVLGRTSGMFPPILYTRSYSNDSLTAHCARDVSQASYTRQALSLQLFRHAHSVFGSDYFELPLVCPLLPLEWNAADIILVVLHILTKMECVSLG
jgi:hypothetical protein